MRRLWLQIALVLLVFVDLAFLPLVVLGISASLTVAPEHQGTSGGSVAGAVLLGAALLALTFVVGRAWHRAPRPGATPESN